MLLTLSLSIIIGLMLGLLGGGGSILTVPMLVYILHIEPKLAITTSFVVVALSSIIALIPHARRRAVCWKSGLLFGLSGMTGAFGGGRLAANFSNDALMIVFGAISFTVGLLMLLRNQGSANEAGASHQILNVCPLQAPVLRLLFDGFFVGALTGLVGVGGGFLIVPALTLWVGLQMQGAIGTSLLVIAMNACAGLMGYSQHVIPDMSLTAWVATGAIIGSFLGALLSCKIRPLALRKVFGVMVISIALYVLSQTLSLEIVSSLQPWLTDAQHWGKIIVGLFVLWLIIRIGYWIHQDHHAW